jgi:hypothetical protein
MRHRSLAGLAALVAAGLDLLPYFNGAHDIQGRLV